MKCEGRGKVNEMKEWVRVSLLQDVWVRVSLLQYMMAALGGLTGAAFESLPCVCE